MPVSDTQLITGHGVNYKHTHTLSSTHTVQWGRVTKTRNPHGTTEAWEPPEVCSSWLWPLLYSLFCQALNIHSKPIWLTPLLLTSRTTVSTGNMGPHPHPCCLSLSLSSALSALRVHLHARTGAASAFATAAAEGPAQMSGRPITPKAAFNAI